ncbi:MAG: DUF4271 domain-containing protein [Bacteroidota bacterium]
MEWIERVQTGQPGWLFISLFVLIAIFAWIRIYYGNILMQTIQASVNFRITSKMFEDNSLLQKQLDNILHAIYFLSVGLLVYLAETRYQLFPYGLSGPLLYLFNMAVLAGIFLARIVLINLVGFLFNRTRIFREYLYNAFIYNKLLGVSVLPLLVFVLYTTGIVREVFHWAALLLVFSIIIMRMIRGISYSFKKDISIFYLFLYLCALEIAPLILFYRWLEEIL